jgi:hypothetical protein
MITRSPQSMINSHLRRSRSGRLPASVPASLELVARTMILLMALLLLEPCAAFSGVRITRSKACTSAMGAAVQQDSTTEQQHHDYSRWWKKPFVAVTETDSTTTSVDDYLRFLEKRYTRLYEDEPEAVKQQSFRVLDWLKQGQSEQQQELLEQQPSHAFYAVGVAGIAGKQLLQAHANQQQPLPLTSSRSVQSLEKTASTSIHQRRAPEIIQTHRSGVAAVISMTIAPLMRQLLARRRVFLRLQSRRARSLVAALVKAATTLPQTLGKQLWNTGGGKENVLATCSLMVAVGLVLLKLLVTEAVSS